MYYKNIYLTNNRGRINTLIFAKIDRFSRSLKLALEKMEWLKSQNIDVISVSENLDTSTAMGRNLLNIMLSFAQLERERTRERVQEAQAIILQKQNKFMGRCPIGLLTVKNTNNEVLAWKIDKEKIHIVNFVFNRFLEGLNYNEIKINLELEHNFIISFPGIKCMLKNKNYCGYIKWGGKHIKFDKIPIIMDEDKYNKVQEKITEVDKTWRRRPK